MTGCIGVTCCLGLWVRDGICVEGPLYRGILPALHLGGEGAPGNAPHFRLLRRRLAPIFVADLLLFHTFIHTCLAFLIPPDVFTMPSYSGFETSHFPAPERDCYEAYTWLP